MKILVIHGPNLNMLGKREVNIYGRKSLDEINSMIEDFAKSKNVYVECFQSNSESGIIDKLTKTDVDAVVINPAAFTHTSVAIMDAITACQIPTVEVHLSNIHAREDFRKKSITARACVGQISGFGTNSYILGLIAAMDLVKDEK